MFKLRKNLQQLLFIVIISYLFVGCQDREPEPDPIEPGANAAINEWIQDVMDQVYYWLEDMGTPISKDAEPEDYFEALLNRPTDRYSQIFPDYQELINNLQGVSQEAGYELSLARESNQNENVLAFVVYIKKGSPAEAEGLRRGDVITEINGERINLNNFQTLLRQRRDTHTVTFVRFNQETAEYQIQPEVSLSTTTFAENPNFLDTVYTIENQKIGYVVYHFFAPGTTAQPTNYDDQMDGIFANFKGQGIDHLIVDFRYNGGGFVSSAVNLASLIGPGVTSEDIFSKTKYNSFLESVDERFIDVTTPFKTKAENLGNTLSGNRLYVITSGRTASASELIINGLRPYMDVFIVGGTTEGKNVGSVAIEDEDNPENNYGLLPIVTQSFNSNDESDYTTGFRPDVEANELSQPFLRPLGDIDEYLLSLTLDQIRGTSQARLNLVERIEVGNTFDRKIRQGKLIEDKIEFPMK